MFLYSSRKQVVFQNQKFFSDFNKIWKAIEKGPKLQGKEISIKRVPKCKRISVKNETVEGGGVDEVTLDLAKQFDDPKDATEFEKKLDSFVKEEVKIPKGILTKVQEAIEDKRDEYEAEKVDFSFQDLRVTLVGERKDVAHKKKQVEVMVDKFTEEAEKKSTVFAIEDKNKLKFLNFIEYFKKLITELPEVQIHGTDGTSGNLLLLGTAEKIKDVQLRILQDLVKISEIEVKMSERQIDFLRRTNCEIVNAELKKDDVMLMLLSVKGAVGAKAWQAKIFSLKKCSDNEVDVS